MRAVLHARVSTPQQREQGYGLERQLRDLHAFAEQLNAEIVEVIASDYANEGDDREDIDRLLTLCANGAVDAVIFHRVDRTTRGGLGEFYILRDAVRALGIDIYFALTKEKYEPTPEMEMSVGLRVLVAAYEKHSIRERLTGGWNTKALRGDYIGHGKANYGYTREVILRPGQRKQTNLLEDPETAAIVREIYDRYTGWNGYERQGVRAIKRALDERKVPTPIDLTNGRYRDRKKRGYADWNTLTLYKILKNPIYKGTAYVHRFKSTGKVRSRNNKRYVKVVARPPSEWLGAKVPALVSEEQWNYVQQLLSEGRQQSPRTLKYDYLLRSRIKCACGCSLKCKRVVRPNGHIHRYYICHGKDPAFAHTCGLRSVDADELEALAWDWFLREALRADRFEAAEDQQPQETPTQHLFDRQLVVFQERLIQLDQEWDELRRQLRRKLISENDFLKDKAEIEATREGVEKEIARIKQQQAEREALAQHMEALRPVLEHYRATADTAPLTERAAMFVDLNIWLGVEQQDHKTLVAHVYSPYPFDEERDVVVLTRP